MAVNNLSATQLFELEKKAGNRAARTLSDSLRSAVAQTTDPVSFTAQKRTGASARYKDNRLTRIAMRAPHYIFKQHYGFEGRKKNGVNMRLRPTNVINIALEKANILESLADELTDIRAEEVFTKINFQRNVR